MARHCGFPSFSPEPKKQITFGNGPCKKGFVSKWAGVGGITPTKMGGPLPDCEDLHTRICTPRRDPFYRRWIPIVWIGFTLFANASILQKGCPEECNLIAHSPKKGPRAQFCLDSWRTARGPNPIWLSQRRMPVSLQFAKTTRHPSLVRNCMLSLTDQQSVFFPRRRAVEKWCVPNRVAVWAPSEGSV